MDYKYYYDNCIYNNIKIGQIRDFEVKNITAKLDMIYIYTKKYFDLLFYNKHK